MKAQHTHPKPQPDGWHPADIVAALRKRGWSLRRLSVHHGYSPTVLAVALRRPWPQGEGLIAAAIGVAPAELWPERYGADGCSCRRPGYRPLAVKDTGAARNRNGNSKAAN
jgi:Ner family transcriptional regulator